MHLSRLRVLASVCLFFLKSLPFGVASFWGDFGISEMPVSSTARENTRVFMFVFLTPPVLRGRCFEQLVRHFGSSDSLVWGGSCVRWARRRFYSDIIVNIWNITRFYTSFVVFVFFKGCLVGEAKTLFYCSKNGFG